MASYPRVAPHISALPPQPAGKPISEVKRELGLTQVTKLASNENPHGPSLAAIAAIHRAALDIHRYPDASHFDLKQALSTHHDVQHEQIVLGNGSSELIDLLVRTYVDEEGHVLTSEGTFIAYRLSTESLGREYRSVPLNSMLQYDLDGLLRAVDEDTRLVFIANPNNPTGSTIPPRELLDFIERLDAQTHGTSPIVVIDEAYIEYVHEDHAVDSLKLLKERPSTVVLRTFSKAYGLAGIRCGYALTSREIAHHLDRVRSPFNVGSLAQAASIAVLEDRKALARNVQMNRAHREVLTTELAARGLTCAPSQANFLLVDLPVSADRVFEELLQLGIITRPMLIQGSRRHLRITIGTAEENARLIAALDQLLPRVWVHHGNVTNAMPCTR